MGLPPSEAKQMIYMNWLSYYKGSQEAKTDGWRQTRRIIYYSLASSKIKRETDVFSLPGDKPRDLKPKEKKELLNRFLESEKRKEDVRE